MSCADGHCVTCADEAAPLTVLGDGSEPGTAICGGDGERTQLVMTDLVGPTARGDVLLVHAGVALERLDPPDGGAA